MRTLVTHGGLSAALLAPQPDVADGLLPACFQLMFRLERKDCQRNLFHMPDTIRRKVTNLRAQYLVAEMACTEVYTQSPGHEGFFNAESTCSTGVHSHYLCDS